jgi:hypothetical protein
MGYFFQHFEMGIHVLSLKVALIVIGVVLILAYGKISRNGVGFGDWDNGYSVSILWRNVPWYHRLFVVVIHWGDPQLPAFIWAF